MDGSEMTLLQTAVKTAFEKQFERHRRLSDGRWEIGTDEIEPAAMEMADDIRAVLDGAEQRAAQEGALDAYENDKGSG
jgi:hypothetical protein